MKSPDTHWGAWVLFVFGFCMFAFSLYVLQPRGLSVPVSMYDDALASHRESWQFHKRMEAMERAFTQLNCQMILSRERPEHVPKACRKIENQ